MQGVSTIDSLRAAIGELREKGCTIGFVPTMGALHAGHMALVEEAKRQCDAVVVSIYVNPTQFDQQSDLDTYPDRLAEDKKLLEDAGVDILYLPTSEVMYPDGFSTPVTVTNLGEGLCGASRPGHFDGVATVVSKLFLQVAPDTAFFGDKDYQQLLIIRRMTADLNIPVKVESVPTVREKDGLALSSRNLRLSQEQRTIAPKLFEVLTNAARGISGGNEVDGVLNDAKKGLHSYGIDNIDYLEFRSADDLRVLDHFEKPARLFIAARLGGVRLIDNIAVE